MKFVRWGLALLAAGLGHFLLVRLWPGAGSAVNFFAIVLVLFARRSGASSAAFVGGSLGWLQDALNGSLFGLHGIAGTVAGFAVARVSQQVRLEQPALLAVVFAVVVAFQEVVVAMLLSLLLPEPPVPEPLWVLIASIATGVVGGLLIHGLGRVSKRWSGYRRGRQPKMRFEGRNIAGPGRL